MAFGVARRKYVGESDEVKILAPIDASWLAAVIDSEGHISISNRGYLRIVVVNTSKDLLDHCKDITGVGYFHERKSGKSHWKQAWSWTCNGWAAINLLKQVTPYIIAKKTKLGEALNLAAYKEN